LRDGGVGAVAAVVGVLAAALVALAGLLARRLWSPCEQKSSSQATQVRSDPQPAQRLIDACEGDSRARGGGIRQEASAKGAQQAHAAGGSTIHALPTRAASQRAFQAYGEA
jgi:hypothetical protein